VQSQQKRKAKRVFDTLTMKRDGYSHKASKWFGDFKDRLGFAKGTKTFHSFRHTFADTLKQAQVDESITAALIGHGHDAITYGRYGKDYNPEPLQAAVEMLEFEGLELGNVRWLGR
jgi:integrase